MRRSTAWLGVATGTLLLVRVVVAHAHEEKVPLDKVPKPVMQAVEARFEGAEVMGAGKQTENGKLVYEVTIRLKGQKIDVTSTPEGEILVEEKGISAKDLPKAVARTLEDKYPQATYKIVEEIIKVEKKEEKPAYYEVLVVPAGKKAVEVEVTAEGKILNEEQKKDSDEDDEEEE